MTVIRGLGVLLWKQARVRYRRWLLSALEQLGAVIPLALVLVLVMMTKMRFITAPFHSQPQSISDMWEYAPPLSLLWAPAPSPFFEDIMTRAAHKLHLSSNDLTGFASEEALLKEKIKELEGDHRMIAVIFQNTSSSEEPETLAYRLRSSYFFDTSRTSPLLPFPGHNTDYGQQYNSFVSIQVAIDLAFIEKRAGKEVNMSFSIQEFPYPAYQADGLLWSVFSILLPLSAALGAVLLLVITVVRLVAEKASGIKELMKMMGVSSNLLWTSHYLNCLSLQLPVIAVQMCLLKVGTVPLVPASDTLILIISLFLYINYVIFFAFAFSTFFSRPLLASVIASVVWVVTMIVTMIPGLTNSTAATLALSFLPNMPIFWMYQVIGIKEMVGTGVTWSSLLFQPQESILSVGLLWLLIVLHSLLYCLLTWYMEKVYPGPYGVPHPHGFLFTKKYWWPHQVSQGLEEETKDPSEQPDPTYFESPGQDAEVGVNIENLWKVYGGWGQARKTALAGVTMQVLRGGITVLLGHNGAGKTTLMSIITGMYQATRGTVTLGEQAQVQAPHHSMGLCPQHNLTFPDLTLREHLIFFSMIKGIKYKSAVKECGEVLDRLQLSNKAEWLCANLSGGQRRRAQLAMALVGRPALLVLDEPTTGLDPQSRRQLWDILLEIREKHTILITTHFMEEADILGDRVAILDHGQLRCYGTPMFLKKVFGTGYTLSILLDKQGQDVTTVEKVEQVIGAHVTAERLTEGGSEADLRWRLQPAPAPALPALFRALEHQRDMLHISSMGLSLTTLEEVFLRVTEGVLEDRGQLAAEETEGDCSRYLSGAELLLSRTWALIVKKLLYFNSIKISLILQLLLACGMFLIPLLSLEGSNVSGGAYPSLLLAPPPHTRPLLLPYFANGTAPPRQLPRLTDMFNLTLEHTQRDVYEVILEEGEKHPQEGYTGPLLLAISFSPEEWRVLYSTSVYHGLPAATALLTNLIAMELLPASSAVLLSPSSHPLPHFEYVPEHNSQNGKSFVSIIYWASCGTISCFLLVAIFLPYTILERVTWSGGLVGLGGASPFLRWAALLLTDLLLICMPISTALVILTCILDLDKTFTLPDTAGPLLTLLWFHLLASLSFAYCLGIFMKQPAAGYIVYLVITIFLGVLMAQVVTVSSELGENRAQWVSVLDVAGSLLVPPYTLCHGLLSLGKLAAKNARCLATSADQLCCETNVATGECVGLLNYFSFDENGIAPHILYMCASITLYTMVLMLYEYGLWQRVWEVCTTLSFQYPQLSYHDSGVDSERKIVQDEVDSGKKGDSRVLLHRLAKRYMSSHTAVKEFSISIKKGECFGLLGANGAGKSTIFGMVVGTQVPTRGTVYHGELGYCPQFEALDGYLTGRQILSLFCLLRGEPPSLVPPRVEAMLRSAGLKEYADMANRKYSGGNRRKLSTLVALSGGGRGGAGAVLLDEPSAGVDPHSRLALHRLIQAARLRGLSILLSSHSMEECEKLVSRLGILSFGELTCLGPVQTLKDKFGSGFLLSLRLRAQPVLPPQDSMDPTTDAIILTTVELVKRLKLSICETFPCQLKDQHLTILQYHISDKECQYSELFSRMEEIRERNSIILEDYTISNTTLEQVFLSFSTGIAPAQAGGSIA